MSPIRANVKSNARFNTAFHPWPGLSVTRMIGVPSKSSTLAFSVNVRARSGTRRTAAVESFSRSRARSSASYSERLSAR